MSITETCYGTWSGGRFMHFGEMLDEGQYLKCIELAYESGIRTFVTADVYGCGKADVLLGQALGNYPRESFSLVGMLGHDFYKGERQGSAGYPRFTNEELHQEADYGAFLTMACERSLERCNTSYFDAVLLHNPDQVGYTNERVWEAMSGLRDKKLTTKLGIAPGPANGFVLDLIDCFENFGEVIDWAMLILNPLEPWPMNLVLPTAKERKVDILTRVVDYGGLFHDDVKSSDSFRPGDHRNYRPKGWVETGLEKIERMRPIAQKYELSLLQLAVIWNLSQDPVKSVVPTFIQETGEGVRPIADKIRELGQLPSVRLTPEEVETVRLIGDNTGRMQLKGASKRHLQSERPDEWPINQELLALADKKGLGQSW